MEFLEKIDLESKVSVSINIEKVLSNLGGFSTAKSDKEGVVIFYLHSSFGTFNIEITEEKYEDKINYLKQVLDNDLEYIGKFLHD